VSPVRFADRLREVQPSGIRRMFEGTHRTDRTVDLSIGMGDFPVPEPVRSATARAAEEGDGRYSPTGGFPDLVEATRRHLSHRFGLGEDEPVMMTAGASGALTLALLALAGPGDEVLIPDPHFVLYRNLVHLVGAVPTSYDLYPDFRLRPERVESALTPRTRVVIVNTPANPTGARASADELQGLADLCAARDVVLVSDELYADFCYDAPHVSLKHLAGGRAVLVGGFSKAYGMAGWRLGWAAGCPEVIDKLRLIQQFTFTCPPTLVQRGALAAFDVDLAPQVAAARRKRDRIYEALRDAGYDAVRPEGSFFLYPRVPWGDDETFCAAALRHDLLIVPGGTFSSRRDHFRLCFAVPDEVLERGIGILRALREGPRGR